MYLTFDVETWGLWGEAFAVGYVLTDDNGGSLLEGLHCCPLEDARWDFVTGREASEKDAAWLRQNVLPHLPSPDCFTTRAIRDKFTQVYREASKEATRRNETLFLAADVPFPCEVHFLAALRLDNPAENAKLMPYPLIDVASMLLCAGYHPVDTIMRLDREKPAHNPLNDARQSSRILHQLLRGEPIE